jgi:hypothetical protein
MRNVSNKRFKKNENEIFDAQTNFFFKNLAIYEITGEKNIVKPGKLQMTICHMPIAC